MLGHCGDLQLEFATPEKSARRPHIPSADMDRQRSVYLPDPERDKRDAENMAELDQMVAMGWGDTPQPDIPTDWRTCRGTGTTWKKTPTEWRQLSWRRKNRKRMINDRIVSNASSGSNACGTMESCPTTDPPSQAA